MHCDNLWQWQFINSTMLMLLVFSLRYSVFFFSICYRERNCVCVCVSVLVHPCNVFAMSLGKSRYTKIDLCNIFIREFFRVIFMKISSKRTRICYKLVRTKRWGQGCTSMLVRVVQNKSSLVTWYSWFPISFQMTKVHFLCFDCPNDVDALALHVLHSAAKSHWMLCTVVNSTEINQYEYNMKVHCNEQQQCALHVQTDHMLSTINLIWLLLSSIRVCVCFLYRSHLLHVVNRHYFERQKYTNIVHMHIAHTCFCFVMLAEMRANVCSTEKKIKTRHIVAMFHMWCRLK